MGVTQSRGLHSGKRSGRGTSSLDEGTSDESTGGVESCLQRDNPRGAWAIGARKAWDDLAARQHGGAALSRATAKGLAEAGLSGADLAVVLEVSPQRVSQLLNA